MVGVHQSDVCTCVRFVHRLPSRRHRRSTVRYLPSPTTCSSTTIPSTVDVHADWTRPTTVRTRPISAAAAAKIDAGRRRSVFDWSLCERRQNGEFSAPVKLAFSSSLRPCVASSSRRIAISPTPTPGFYCRHRRNLGLDYYAQFFLLIRFFLLFSFSLTFGFSNAIDYDGFPSSAERAQLNIEQSYTLL